MKKINTSYLELFLIKAEEKSAAGYQTKLIVNESEFEIIQETYDTLNVNQLLVGGGGMKMFVLKALKKGICKIEVEEARPFDYEYTKRIFQAYEIHII